MRAHTVPIAAASSRLLDYLREHLVTIASNELSELVTTGGVTVNGEPSPIDRPLAAGDLLVLDAVRAAALRTEGRWIAPADLPVDAVYEDEDLLVVDKASGMHVHPLGKYRDETLVNALVFRAGARAESPWAEWRPHAAHRIDRPTSGLIAIAKSGAIRDSLRKLIDDRKVSRRYLARVRGAISGESGVIDSPLGKDPADDYRFAVVPEAAGGQTALTRWRVVERGPDSTLLELVLETGRTHQIRVHLASIGHPVEDDTLYIGGPKSPNAPSIRLHAFSLAFPHPRHGGALAFERAAPWRTTSRD